MDGWRARMTLMAMVAMLGSASKIPPGYLTIDQATEEFVLSRESLFRWIKRRELRSYKVGGVRNTLVKRDDLLARIGPQPKQSD